MANSRPSLTVLLPSYCEEPDVVRSTLLSAALQEYPGLRVVLLLDDPYRPAAAAVGLAAACRRLPEEINALLGEPLARFEDALEGHEAAALLGGAAEPSALRALARDFDGCVKWLRRLAGDQRHRLPAAINPQEKISAASRGSPRRIARPASAARRRRVRPRAPWCSCVAGWCGPFGGRLVLRAQEYCHLPTTRTRR